MVIESKFRKEQVPASLGFCYKVPELDGLTVQKSLSHGSRGRSQGQGVCMAAASFEGPWWILIWASFPASWVLLLRFS